MEGERDAGYLFHRRRQTFGMLGPDYSISRLSIGASEITRQEE